MEVLNPANSDDEEEAQNKKIKKVRVDIKSD
jgi:hypothetical protein